MSEHGFHVHGPHDHELEHATQHGEAGGGMVNQVAMFTAVISTIGAIFAYMGGLTQANALLYKNNAQIKTTEAGDQWNFYQAKSSKQNLSELAAAIVADDKKEFYRKEVERYKNEKAEVMVAAKKLEDEAKDWDKRSESELHVHHRWAEATTAIQVSIALAAMALLTKKKWLEWGMFGVGGIGVAIGIFAMFHM